MIRHWLCEGCGPFRSADALPLTDRGFRYGMAVFETLRVRSSVAEFMGEHLWRLARACRASGFPVPGRMLREAARLLREAAAKADATWTGVARIHVTAGDGGPADPPRCCRLLVSLEPREPTRASLYHDGLRLRVHPAAHQPIFGGRKTHNYWSNVEPLQAAYRDGAEEALLADTRGRLISACMGNVFLVKGNALVTPPGFRGARAGVQRARVLQLLPTTVRDLPRAEWQSPGAAFLVTNSWLGVVPGFVTGNEPDAATWRSAVALARSVNGDRWD